MSTVTIEMKKNFGVYQIESCLGQGGIGLVYAAFDPNIKRKVAIKTIRKELLGDEGDTLLARFKIEAQAAGQLTHPKIVGVYGYGEEDGTPYIVMEYAQGRTIKDLIDKKVGLELKDIVDIISQLLEALAYSHKHNVVHRDIKPANIIMHEGTIKVMDFGIAKIEASTLTVLGDLMGTPNYMSPEQWEGVEVDHRTDIFSTGVLLYQLLTGEKPFSGENQMIVRNKTINIDPPAPSKVNPRIPPMFDAVVMKSLAKQPAARYQTADAFRDALRKALEGFTRAESDGTVVHPGRNRGKPQPAPTPRSFRGIALAAALVLAIGAGVGTYWWYSQKTPATVQGAAEIQTEPSGAVVTLASGEFLGTTPARIQLAPGEYQLILKNDGYSDLEASIEIEPNVSVPITLTLSKRQ
jgi:serine/threonine-protein kinase